MSRFSNVLFWLLAYLLFAPTAIADMGMVHVSTNGVTVSESTQKTIIPHNKHEEVLILTPLPSGVRRAPNAEKSENIIDRYNPPLLPQYKPACLKKPDRGPCKGRFEAYYFDSDSRKCKMFIWGGCQGEVPFQSLRDCERTCFIPLPE